MNNGKWGLGLMVFLGVLGLGRLAHGQEALVVHPALSQIFPLSSSPEGVRLQFPVLLNDHMILKPTAVLRFVYIDLGAGVHPHGGERDSDRGKKDNANLSDGGTSMSGAVRKTAELPDPVDKSTLGPAEGKDATGEIRTEVWTKPESFREALNHATDIGTTVVYAMPDKKQPLSATFNLPEGMVLGETEGRVKVLGLADDSRALRGGMQPGDEIRSLQGKLNVATLEEFLKTYVSVKEAAKASGESAYSIEVWRPDESRLISIRMVAPPSIHSLL